MERVIKMYINCLITSAQKSSTIFATFGDTRFFTFSVLPNVVTAQCTTYTPSVSFSHSNIR